AAPRLRELPGAPDRADRHRGQDRRRTALLQLGRPDLQHRGPELSRAALRRPLRLPQARVLQRRATGARDAAAVVLTMTLRQQIRLNRLRTAGLLAVFGLLVALLAGVVYVIYGTGGAPARLAAGARRAA